MKTRKYMALNKLMGISVWIILFLGINATVISQDYIKPTFPVFNNLEVNTFNGNLIYTRQDFLIKGNMPINITFYYNSVNDTVDYGYGSGWYFNYGMNYYFDSLNNVVIIRNGGRKDLYLVNGANYTTPVGIYDELVEYEPQKFVLKTKEAINYYFGNPAHKKLTSITDNNGNSITITYASGFPAAISNSSGRSASFSWTNDHLSGITYNNTSYTYNYTDNRLSKMTNPKGFSESYQYLANGKLAVILDYNKFPVYIQYTDGVVVSSVQSCLAEKSFSFTENKSFVIENGKEGKQITSYTYDSHQRVVQITTPNQKSVLYEYDNNNNVTKFTDFEGEITLFTYDANGNLLTSTNPAGLSTQATYNPANKLISSTDEKGNTSNFSYDSEGNLLTVYQPLSVTKSFSYNGTGNIIQSVDPLGHSTGFTWDANKNITQITYPIGTVGMTYDNFGNLTKITDANSNSLEFEYNGCTSCGKVSKLKVNDSISTQFGYDGNGNLVQETDANGNHKTYGYDGLNRLNTVTIPAGTTKYQYDEQSNLTKLIDANNHSTQYDYNSNNQVTSETDPLGKKASYSYDANGNLVSETDANGNTIQYTYNSLNQLVQKSYPGNSDHFAYDALGNLISMYNNDINLSYTYDALNRLTSKTINNWNKTISYTYDKAGNRITMIDPDGGITHYAYDANSRLISLTNPFAETTTFEYDPGGRVTRQNNSNGTFVEYTYNQRNLLVTLNNKRSSGEKISSYYYTYDKFGNRTTMTVNDTAVHLYTYDASHRLTKVSYPDGMTERFTYDGAGNRMTYQINDTIKTYIYNQADQLISDGKATYTFDNNGNMTSKTENGQTTVYVYNALDRLIKIQYYDGTENIFIYDPTGNRICSTNKLGQETRYILDGDNVIIEANSSGTVLSRYTCSLKEDSWLSMHRDNVTYVFHKDGASSTTELSNDEQTTTAHYSYGGFGSLRKKIGSIINPYLFSGREYDNESSKYYYRSRYYDPSSARFITKNIKNRSLKNPQYQNQYSLAANNPISFRDPYGQSAQFLGAVYQSNLNQHGFENPLKTNSLYQIWKDQGLYNEETILQKSGGFASCILTEFLQFGQSKFVKPIQTLQNVLTLSKIHNSSSAYKVTVEMATSDILGYAGGTLGAKGGFIVGEMIFPFGGGFLGAVIGGVLGTCAGKQLGSELGGLIADKTYPWVEKHFIAVLRPMDPNEILGPPGYDSAKWVSIRQNLAYNVLFENDPDFATAPAQNVLIKVPVSAKLNMNDFRLDRFGFGSYIFEVPQNSASYTTRLDLRDSLGLFVDVTAGLNVNTQEAFWLFESIDPTTGLSPTDPLIGFLPVNDTAQNAGNGEGFVSFTIKPKSTDQTGDSLLAHASIVFDNNAPILTNTWKNIVDALPPVSSVDSIPPDVGSNIYYIAFSSQDDPGGCGVSACQLYTSKDGAPFILYGEFKPDTLLKFTGSGGSTYRFFSIAKDHVGNIEPMKTVPDATTTFHDIILIPAITNVTCFSYSNGAIDLSVNGGVPPYSYSWSNGATTMNVNNLTAGTYIVTVTDNDSFTASASYEVNEPPLWSVDFTGPLSVCGTTSIYKYCKVIIDNANPGATYSYFWIVNGGTLITGQNTSCIMVRWLPGNQRMLTLKAVRMSDGCLLSKTKSVIVNLPPVPTIIGNTSVCFNSSGNIYNTEPGMTNYTWNVSPGGTITEGGTNSSNATIVTWNISGPQSVSVNYTNSNGCIGIAPTVYPVQVSPLFEVGSVADNQIICFNTTPALLTGNVPAGGNPPYSYQWQSSSDEINYVDISGATSLNYAPPALTSTTYFRQIQTSANSCGALATNGVTITVYPEFIAGSISSNQTICYNTIPGELTGTLPIGGNAPYHYEWQFSDDNITFTTIPGATSLNYSPGALTSTTYYRQVQTSASDCGSLTTNVVTIAVHPEFVVGSISGNQEICYNTTPVGLTGMPPTGGNAPYTYQWQSSTDNETFTSIYGATSLIYAPPPLTSTTYYRQIQTSTSECGSLTSNVVTITVYPQFAVGSISDSQVICYNTIPGELTGISPSGGNIPFTYQWQLSDDNVTFTNINGATSLNYSPGALILTTYYRQVQTSANGCGSQSTNVVTITVYAQFAVGSISESQVICYNAIPNGLSSTAPSGGSTPFNYQWQSSTDNADYTSIPGATSQYYSPPALTSTTYYRQIQVSASGCGSLITNVVTITVYPQFTVGSISESQAICYNSLPFGLTGTVPSGGNTPFTYQWQSSADNVNFTVIPDATSLNYSPPALTSTTYYRQIQTSANGCGTTPTNTISITVYPQFNVGSISESQVICHNTIPGGLSGIEPSGGKTPFNYQWQRSIDNVNFTNIIGATSLNYAPPSLTATTFYRQIQTSAGGCGTLMTNVVTITVSPQFFAGSISTGQALCYNTIPVLLTGTAPIGGYTPFTYQWQHSTDNVTFSNIAGATSLNYAPPALTASTYYRQVQTSANSCGSLTTNVILITVYPEFLAGSIGTNQMICHNTIPFGLSGTTPSGGKTPYTYQWQRSPDNVTFTNIGGATSLNYAPPVLTSTTYFRQIQTSASNCGTLTTNLVTITVNPQFVVGSIASNQEVCYNTIPAPITGTSPTGGKTPYSYQWQKSSDNITFTNISGASSLNYTPPALTSTTYYRQVQYSGGGCGSLTTNTITIEVKPQFVEGSIAENQMICYNTVPSMLAGSAPYGGEMPYTYQWQHSTDNVTFTNVVGATTLNYAPPALTSTTYYRQIQSSASGCGSLQTNFVTITVYPEFIMGSIAADQTILYNTVPVALTRTSPTGGNSPYTYQWQNSTDNITFSDIPGATSVSYQPGALLATTYYRQAQSSSNGCTGPTPYTNVVTITVYPNMVAGTIAADQTIYQHGIPAPLSGTVPSGGNPPYYYQWQSSEDNVTFYNIYQAIEIIYQPGSLATTTYFKLIQISTGDFGVETNVVTISVVPLPPQDLELTNITIPSNQTQCYDATQTITVAGNGTSFLVQSGGSVKLIAGVNIYMLAGSRVELGGYLNGYITESDQYCLNLNTPIPATPIQPIFETIRLPESSSEDTFGCFPNPTAGRFNLWLSTEPEQTPVTVMICNLLGVEILSKTIYSGKIHEFSLENQTKGVYFVRVMQNGKVGIFKIVRQ